MTTEEEFTQVGVMSDHEIEERLNANPRIDPVRYVRISPSDMDKIANLVVGRMNEQRQH